MPYSAHLDKRQLRAIITAAISIRDWFPQRHGNQICPFHDDNSPSAKIYGDADGDHLYCHTCRKQFSSFDYIEQILQRDPLQYLRETLPSDRVEFLLSHPPVVQEHRKSVDISTQLEEYRNTHNLDQLLNNIYGAVAINE
jgi:hypothetical protein